jgi:hypothetical protein
VFEQLCHDVEVYVTKVSLQKTPMVISRLFEFGADENLIRRILMTVVSACPVDDLQNLLILTTVRTDVSAGHIEELEIT